MRTLLVLCPRASVGAVTRSDEKAMTAIVSIIVAKTIIFLISVLLMKKYCTMRRRKRHPPEELHRDLAFPWSLDIGIFRRSGFISNSKRMRLSWEGGF
jgi:hypothetical protein